jgi:hypothetical protein
MEGVKALPSMVLSKDVILGELRKRFRKDVISSELGSL